MARAAGDNTVLDENTTSKIIESMKLATPKQSAAYTEKGNVMLGESSSARKFGSFKQMKK